MPDILSRILHEREENYRAKGASFGTPIPPTRQRPVIPFLGKPGLVLEIKRASPSKGAIALDLDPVKLARRYRASGAVGISVLTEQRYFKGSLDDLISIGSAIQDVSLLRKDFPMHEDEIEVSYLAGADAVLLIARILPVDRLRSMAIACRDLGMTPFVEVRDDADLEKLADILGDGEAIAGVNARDLKNFSIDPLVPAAMRDSIPCKAIYESGADSSGCCRYARSLGYEGMLIGESVARDPTKASTFVEAFASMQPNDRGSFWKKIAHGRTLATRPLVKICGITNKDDARLATSLGADLLGFVFADSPRRARSEVVEDIVGTERMRPLMVGVVTELDSKYAQEAIDLALRGLLDALQCHGGNAIRMLRELAARYGEKIPGCYAAIGIGDLDDIELMESVLKEGEPRVLCDTRIDGHSGGTGKAMSEDLIRQLGNHGHLWIAGGLGVDTVAKVIQRYSPELVDVSSRLESAPGKKDRQLMRRFFQEVNYGH